MAIYTPDRAALVELKHKNISRTEALDNGKKPSSNDLLSSLSNKAQLDEFLELDSKYIYNRAPGSVGSH